MGGNPPRAFYWMPRDHEHTCVCLRRFYLPHGIAGPAPDANSHPHFHFESRSPNKNPYSILNANSRATFGLGFVSVR